MSLAILSLTILGILQQGTSFPLRRDSYASDPPKAVAAGYYSWHDTDPFPLSSISWEKYNMLIYAFAVTTPSVDSLSLDGSNPSLLPDFVSQAHKNGVAAHVGFGGWYGSRYFSSNVATPGNRTAFVKTVVDFADQYHLDGINFDWEYPNALGVGCNVISPDDTQNFLSFLQELRATSVGANMTLSAAAPINPFLDSSGKPSTDVSGFAEVLDYISVMDYDVFGSWSSNVGPNSPLNDTCAASAEQQGSAVSAVKAWTMAGMPLDKIVLGTASYGHSFSVSPSDAFADNSKTELAAYPKFNASNQPAGGAWDNTGSVDICGVHHGPGGTYELWGLVDGGFLTTDGDPASGIYYRYDNCSQTPYIYDEKSEIMISFDNAQSYAAKGNFIKEAGLRGFAMWEVGGDHNDILVDSIRTAAGYTSN